MSDQEKLDFEADHEKTLKLIQFAMWKFWEPFYWNALKIAACFGVVSAGIIAAGAGWANNVSNSLDLLKQNDTAQIDVAKERLAQYMSWSDAINRGMSDRFTGSDWDDGAEIFNSKSPIKLPYLREIHKSQKGTP